MEAFAVVAAAESFSEAGRRLALSPSAISKLVTRLEQRLGVRLVTRSTHGLVTTAEGRRYADACQRILDSIEDAEADVCGRQAALSGPLRVSSSGPLAFHVLAPILSDFREQHPRISLQFLISDSLIDLIEERADVALRIGPLQDSALKLRHIGKTQMMCVAAPKYVDAFARSGRPDNASSHTMLKFPLNRRSSGRLTSSGPGIETDSGELLRHLALQGLGVACLARFHIADDLARSDLVEVPMQKSAPKFQDVSAVFPSHKQPAPRVAAFVEYLIGAARAGL